MAESIKAEAETKQAICSHCQTPLSEADRENGRCSNCNEPIVSPMAQAGEDHLERLKRKWMYGED